MGRKGNRIAVILFNLGGPDSIKAVEPFLFNLFQDPAIISIPQPFRWLLAKLISTKRAPIARSIYGELDGMSPLLANTEAQAKALGQLLSANVDKFEHIRCFVAMRYWHPFIEETAELVKAWMPDELILLPLYPQFSTTTTLSSLIVWREAAGRCGIELRTKTICCYPVEPGFIKASAELTRNALREASVVGPPRILFSAHGLPKRVVDTGDPYQWQVEQTAAAIVDEISVRDLDWIVCYQSRVGRLEWIKPYLTYELRRAARDGVPVVIVPLAFVSEHSETLVELDRELREFAEGIGVPGYFRVPTVSTCSEFIHGLGGLVQNARMSSKNFWGGGCPSVLEDRYCPDQLKCCADSKYGMLN